MALLLPFWRQLDTAICFAGRPLALYPRPLCIWSDCVHGLCLDRPAPGHRQRGLYARR